MGYGSTLYLITCLVFLGRDPSGISIWAHFSPLSYPALPGIVYILLMDKSATLLILVKDLVEGRVTGTKSGENLPFPINHTNITITTLLSMCVTSLISRA